MTRFYPIAFVLFLAICAAAVVMSGGRVAFIISIPSLLVVVVTAVVLSLGNFSVGEIGRCFRVAFRRSPAQRAELHNALAFFDALVRYLLVSGFIGTLIGSMAMLGNLTDQSALGRGTALALTTILYALILWVGVVVPFRTGVRRKLTELEKS
jgi:flagellar motor component MotA